MDELPPRIEIFLCILVIVVAAAFSGRLLRPCRPADWSMTAGSVVLLAGCPDRERGNTYGGGSGNRNKTPARRK
jgi:hypothetical protein